MFGYVKAYRPYLRVCEEELYKGIYCGLCKEMNTRCGFITTLGLSYDFVFLTVMNIGLNGSRLKAQKRRCPVHPVKKTPCVYCIGGGDEFAYSADSAVILGYNKLKDDLHDKDIKDKLRAMVVIPFYYPAYRKASGRRKGVSQSVGRAMKQQRVLEHSPYRSLDRAAEPTGAMMRAVFRELGGYDPDMRDTLGEFGYMLGRYVYICDALDDLEDDSRQGNYNPLLGKNKVLDEDAKQRAVRIARASVNITLSRLADEYVKLNLHGMSPITDNIVYLGLKSTFEKTAKKYEKAEEVKEQMP